MKFRKMKSTLFLIMACAVSIIAAGCNYDYEAGAGQAAAHNHDHEEEGISTKTVSGTLSGFDCAVVEVLCPTTHRGADYTTGVFTEDGSFYFVANIPQSFLKQYFLESVEIEGNVYHPYDNTIEPEMIQLAGRAESRLVYEAGYFIDENNRRATFQDGFLEDGRWVVQ